MFPTTYNPQNNNLSSVSLQGGSPLNVIQGSAPNLQPTISADQLNTASLPTTAPNTGSTGGQTAPTGLTAAQTAAALKVTQDAQFQDYLNHQSQSVQDSGTGSADAFGSSYRGSADALINSINGSQSGINEARKGIATGQINSIRGLIDNIQQGLQGGRVSLGNTNALDSSAAQAIGRIMSQYGITQRNSINNDAAVKNDAQDVAQTNLGLTRETGLSTLHGQRDAGLGTINTQLDQGLQGLQSTAALRGITPSFDSAGIKSTVSGHAQGLTNAIDQYITAKLGGINALTPDEVAQKAYGLSNAGVAGTASAGFTPLTAIGDPSQMNGGASTSQLPISAALDSKYKIA